MKARRCGAWNYAGRRRQQGIGVDAAAELDPWSAGGGAYDGGHAGLADEGKTKLLLYNELTALYDHCSAGHIVPYSIVPAGTG